LSILLIVFLTGCYKSNENLTNGAAALYIIHSDKGKKNFEKSLTPSDKHGPIPPKKAKVPVKFYDGLFNENEVEENKRNPLAIKVNTTSTGSMTQAVFFDYCEHFVQSLPSEQGKDALPCILFLDGHASRWSVASLRYLMLNNVYPFFLASHTTIWSQPNDNGTIKRLHSCIEEVTEKYRRWTSAVIPYFNNIFSKGWRLFIERESTDLNSGGNNATSAKTGLYPFNPLCDSWETAIATLGIDKALDLSRDVTTQLEVKTITKEEGRP